MIRVSHLGYIHVGVADVDAWKEFALQTVGLDIGEEGESGLLLRSDAASYRIRVEVDAQNDVLALGWSVPDQETLDLFAQQLEKNAVPYVTGSKAECVNRRVIGFVRFSDPDGIPQEVFHGLKVRPAEPIRPVFPHHGFITGPEGLGHVGIWVQGLETSVNFYRDVLGMRITDWVNCPTMHACFLRSSPRQHSIALLPTPPGGRRQKLHHIQMEMESLNDVGRAYDIAMDHKIVIGTLGKHPAEDAVTFYMKSPAGFGFELGWGGMRIDDATWQVGWHDEKPIWGHRFIGLMD